MFAFLVSASLKVRLLVVAVTAVAMIYGGYSIRGLQIDVLPDLDKGLVTILTEAPGLAAEEIETLITYPIESAMNGATGVSRVRSVSGTGLSIVSVEFDWDTNIYLDRQIVTERLAPVQLDLPTGVQPLIAPISSIMGEIELVALTSTTLDPTDLREVADWVVSPRLRAVPGVARVVPIGGLVKEYRVTIDNLRMSQLKVSFDDIRSALESYGANTGGALINQGSQEFLLRNLARSQSLEDLRNLAIQERDGQPILLRQVADISFEPKQRRGDAGFMGGPAVVLSVQKQPQADTVSLTEAVDSLLDDLQKTMPPGTNVTQHLFRQADFIHASVDNLEEVLGEAIVVVAVILFLFLFDVRTTVISLIAIPVSVLTTFIVLRWMGMTVNTMTLGGLAIAIGELVDGAVVGVENIVRRLRENKKRAQPRPAMGVILAAAQEVRSSIVYSTIIITLVLVPLFTLPGIEGRLFAPLGVAYIVAILASLITSITLTPVLCSYLLPRAKTLEGGEGVVVRFAKRINTLLLSWALEHPRLILSVIGVGVLAASSVVTSLPRSFLPPFSEGSLVVSMTLAPGISLDESVKIARAVEGILLNVPEVVTVGRRTGRSAADEHANGVHVSDIAVMLRRSDRRLPIVLAEIRSRLAGIPAFFNIAQPITHGLVDHILTGVAAEVVIKIFGNDLDTLRSIAHQAEAAMRVIPGLVDVQVERQVPVPQIQIQTDPERALLYGVQPGELAHRLERLTDGDTVTQIVDGSKRFDLVVRLPEAARTTEQLGAMLIDTPSGNIPVSMLAKVSETSGPNQVLRENNQRRLLVTANGNGSNTNLIVASINRMMSSLHLPTGYFMTFEGVYAEQNRSTLRVGGLALISLCLIFIILYSRYRSAALAAIIMGNVPLSLIGAVIAIRVANLDLGVATIVGFVTLIGISSRNGILKMSHYINLMLHEGETFGRKLIIRGANERLVPVLMTASSAIVALMPLLFAGQDAGKEILHPVAVVIFGGLLSSTALDMLLTPLLFQRFAPKALERLLAKETAKGDLRAPVEAH